VVLFFDRLISVRLVFGYLFYVGDYHHLCDGRAPRRRRGGVVGRSFDRRCRLVIFAWNDYLDSGHGVNGLYLSGTLRSRNQNGLCIGDVRGLLVLGHNMKYMIVYFI